MLIPESGADVLLEVKLVLEKWLENRILHIPNYWHQANYKDKSMCLYEVWKGPSKEQCESQLLGDREL